jgi:ABC-2 type transport system ATP-binding protein
MAAVEVEALTVRYGDVLAVDDISFSAEAGAITAVLGPNGAGKTTTIEVLEGYRRPAAGRSSVVGLDPRADHAALTRRIGVMLQAGGVGNAVRAGEALRHAAALYDDPLPVTELLERVGLDGKERRTWRQLSGGEQRRLALALALVGRPQVAFLDEPGSGVDPQGRQVLREVIAGLRDDGVTVLLTSHDLDEVERLADHVVILDRGHVIAADSPERLMTSGTVDEVRFGAPPGLDVAALAAHLRTTVDRAALDPGLPLGPTDAPPLVTEDRPGEYVVAAAGSPALVAALTAWLAERHVALADLRVGRQRLEDVFLRLTSDRDPGVTDGTEPHRRRRRR